MPLTNSNRIRINGRRGAFQILFGVVFGMLATACLIADEFPPTIAWVGMFLHSPSMLAVLWAAPCVLAFIGAFLPRPRDYFSFGAMTVAPTVWGILYVIGAVISPQETSAFGAVLYWAIAGAIMVVSGMAGDRDRDHREVSL